MKSADITMAEHLANVEASRIVAENMAKIVDTKYCKVDLQSDIVDQSSTLNTKDRKNYSIFYRSIKTYYFIGLYKHGKTFNMILNSWTQQNRTMADHTPYQKPTKQPIIQK
eukprot:9180763-Ditylum_brightwellii.AAC.1